MPVETTHAATDFLAATRSGDAWTYGADGALALRAANALRTDYDPSGLTYRGVLVEGAATNLVNGGTEGAAAASPGTPPTGWNWNGSASSMTRTLVGTGTEDGFPYVDLRWSGTPSANLTRDMNFCANTALAAVAGETFLSQVPVRLVAGATTNVGLNHYIYGRNSGGTIVENSTAVITSAVGVDSLRKHIASLSRAMSGGTVAYVQSLIRFTFTNGAAADITLRIGAPALWKSSIGFSPSLAASGAPGASTRNADDLAMAGLSSWFTAGAGTFVLDFMPGQAAADADRGLLLVDDGSTSNRIRARMLAASTTVRLSVDAAGVAVVSALDIASGAALARHTLRLSYGPAGFLMSVNGGAPVSATGAMPAGLARVLVGRALAAGEYLNGWIGPRVAFYPRQYTDAAAADGFTIRTR